MPNCRILKVLVLLQVAILVHRTEADTSYQVTRTSNDDKTVCPRGAPDETRVVRSMIRCAVVCNQWPQCSGFKSNSTSKICELYSDTSMCCGFSDLNSPCKYYQNSLEMDYGDDTNAPLCANRIHPENCSLPFTYNGSLFYGCATNVTSTGEEIGCFSSNRTWKTCCPPKTFAVGYTNETVTIPGLNVTIPVQSVNGWIIFQHRFNGMTNFAQPWTAYQTGFGAWNGEYWMGLEKIHQMTTRGSWMLRIELLGKRNATWWSVEYDNFVIESSVLQYRLRVLEYSWGDMPNVLNSQGANRQNGMKFITYNSDNDPFSGNCAVNFAGGFWYNACWGLNINGNYQSNVFGYALLPPGDPVMIVSVTQMMMKRLA